MQQLGLCLLLVLGIAFQTPLLAQETTSFADGDQMLADGAKYTVPSNGQAYRDLYIPENTSYSYLFLWAEGADGGKRRVINTTNPFNSTVSTINGGAGATIRAFFEIGTKDNMIPPGAQVRFIVGRKGATRTSGGGRGAAGGGGTAVLMKKPNQDEWSLLLVAGAGGGAYGGASVKARGRQGYLTTDGSDGAGPNGADGGTRGGDGGQISGGGGGGKGMLSAWPGVYAVVEKATYDANGKQLTPARYAYDYTQEPTGVAGSTRSGSDNDGGWGFGGGGYGSGSSGGGGGGGGYSGGGGGLVSASHNAGGGGGGGSYINESMAIGSLKTANGSTSTNLDGYVQYQFTNNTRYSYEIQSAATSDKCLDLYQGNTDNYTAIQLNECSGTDGQQWVIDGLKVRLTKDLNKCVNLQNADIVAGDIQLRDCYNKARQDWIYDGLTGTFRSGLDLEQCMSLENQKTADGTHLQIAACDDDNTQQWLIDGAAELTDKSGVKTIYLAQDTEMCLDLYKGITNNSTSEVQLYECTGRSPQQWVFDSLRIKYNQDQDKCVNLDGGNTADGTKIKVRDCYDPDDKARQHWLYDGMMQSFRSGKDPKKCLTVVNGENDKASTFENDQKVKLYDCDGSSAQQWVIETEPCIEDSTPPVAQCKNVTFTRLTVPEASHIDDGSYDDCAISSMDLEQVSSSTYKLWVTDPSGNSSSCTATVSYQ